MALGVDLHLLAQTLLYLAGCIAGLVSAVPLGVTSLNFGGNCLLYANVKWVNITYSLTTYGSSSACDFPVYLLVFGCILYGAAMAGYNAYACRTSRKDPSIGSQMWVMPFLMVNSLVVVCLFIASCLVSVGFAEFCNSLVNGARQVGNQLVKSCVDGQLITWTDSQTGKTFTSSTFVNFLTTAQTVCWFCFLIWAAQAALCLLRLYRNRRGRSGGQGHSPDSQRTTIATVEPTA